MATYEELFDLKNDNDLQHKLYIAVTKKAQTLLDVATPSVNDVAWASDALTNPNAMVSKILPYVLAANSDLTTGQITGATDSAIQTNVNKAVDALIAGVVTP